MFFAVPPLAQCHYLQFRHSAVPFSAEDIMTGSHEGAGLGLSLPKRVVEQRGTDLTILQWDEKEDA